MKKREWLNKRRQLILKCSECFFLFFFSAMDNCGSQLISSWLVVKLQLYWYDTVRDRNSRWASCQVLLFYSLLWRTNMIIEGLSISSRPPGKGVTGPLRQVRAQANTFFSFLRQFSSKQYVDAPLPRMLQQAESLVRKEACVLQSGAQRSARSCRTII